VHLDVTKVPITSFKAVEKKTLNDIFLQKTLHADSSQNSETEIVFAVGFQYLVQEGKERPERYFNQLITKRIDATNFLAGSVGVPYELVIDFTPLAKDLKISRLVSNAALANRGFEVIEERNKITIRGTPRDSVDDSFSFYFKKEGK
jgi:hypothetical protein